MNWKKIFIILTIICTVANAVYKVKVTRISNSTTPLASSIRGASEFDYNYNAAYLDLYANGLKYGEALLIRNQYQTSKEWVATQSVMTLVKAAGENNTFSDLNSIKLERVLMSKVVFQSQDISENQGVEDPRVVQRAKDQTYYMMYSAVQQYPENVTSRLALAITKTPEVKSSWQRKGAVLKDIAWSKSGALLLRDDVGGPHYLYWGDTNITVAKSDDLENWQNLFPIISIRPDHFDSQLVESGPAPLPLSDGNYFFIYNSARAGFPSPRPGYDLQYNAGFVIIDKNDPTKIIQRSEVPILSPETMWERGRFPEPTLVPNVVFIEGIKPLNNDTFLIFYGCSDASLGVALVEVTKDNVAIEA